MSNKGIEYSLTGESDRARMSGYHHSPPARSFNIDAHEIDVKNIKSKVSKDAFSGRYSSNYAIGFEVEKNRFGGRREHELFKGYERDGSCGVEAVTNILPLLPPSQWRNKIFDMMYKAQSILNDATSPSNQNCGGHITISVKRNVIECEDLYLNLRKNIGLLMALFRKRLRNGYCNNNLRMGGLNSVPNNVGGTHYKYQMVLLKNNCTIEFRLPSRVRSYKQMFRRYELIYHMVDFATNKPNARFSSFLNKVKPIVLSMYENDETKVSELFTLAKHFRKFVLTGRIDSAIRPFLNNNVR